MDKENDNQDQSMEEILQSIKRIIADDDEAPTASAAEISEDGGTDSAEVKALDILELDDMVDAVSDDELPAAYDPLSELLDEQSVSQADAPAPQNNIKEPKKEDVLSDIDSLLTDKAAEASSSAIQQLKQVNDSQAKVHVEAPVEKLEFRSGVTIEDLAMEALKPELKNWLNNNLPQIVERLVKAEIEKIAK